MSKWMADNVLVCDNAPTPLKKNPKTQKRRQNGRTRRPPVAIIHTNARFFEVQLGRHGGDKKGKERTTER